MAAVPQHTIAILDNLSMHPSPTNIFNNPQRAQINSNSFLDIGYQEPFFITMKTMLSKNPKMHAYMISTWLVVTSGSSIGISLDTCDYKISTHPTLTPEDHRTLSSRNSRSKKVIHQIIRIKYF
jgi:hypothetical protein